MDKRRRYGSGIGRRAAVGFLLGAVTLTAWGAELKAGDTAPNFDLIGSDGKQYTLEQFKGEKPVILAFFPKAFTGG